MDLIFYFLQQFILLNFLYHFSITKEIADCGQTYGMAPVLPPRIGYIGDAEFASWPWTATICVIDFSGMDCGIGGLVIGNASDLITQWLLTAIVPGKAPYRLLVVIGAKDPSYLFTGDVKVFTVEKVIPFDLDGTDLPILTVLKTYDLIITTSFTKIAPICLPKHREHDERVFNNTAFWTVGWTLNDASELGFRQFYTTAMYLTEDLFLTDIPQDEEMFYQGSVGLRFNGSRWFAEGLSVLILSAVIENDYETVFERPGIVCEWLHNATEKEVSCVDF